MTEPRKMPLNERIAWGVRWGLAFGFVYALYPVVAFLFGGDARFEEHGLSAIGLSALYLVTGVIGGAIVGILRPLARDRAGAALVGAITMIVVCAGFGVALFGMPWTWDSGDTMSVLTAGVLLGVLCGVQTSPAKPE